MIIHKYILLARQFVQFYALDVEADMQKSFIINKCFQKYFLYNKMRRKSCLSFCKINFIIN